MLENSGGIRTRQVYVCIMSCSIPQTAAAFKPCTEYRLRASANCVAAACAAWLAPPPWAFCYHLNPQAEQRHHRRRRQAAAESCDGGRPRLRPCRACGARLHGGGAQRPVPAQGLRDAAVLHEPGARLLSTSESGAWPAVHPCAATHGQLIHRKLLTTACVRVISTAMIGVPAGAFVQQSVARRRTCDVLNCFRCLTRA